MAQLEIRRLDAWVHDEDQDLISTSHRLEASDPLIAAEICCLYAERHRVNNIYHAHLSAIYRLDGYSGPGPYVPVTHNQGQSEGQSDAPRVDEGIVTGTASTSSDVEREPEVLVDEDDTLCDEVLRLDDFMECAAQ